MSVWRSVPHLGSAPADTGPEAGGTPTWTWYTFVDSDQFFLSAVFELTALFQKCPKKKKFLAKLGENTEQTATKLAEESKTQQAVRILVPTLTSQKKKKTLIFWKKTKQKKKNEEIKLLITSTVIHSQWTFCIQLSISKTSTSVRNQLDWCKNTELLQSKVFTHVHVNHWGGGTKTKSRFLNVEKKELHWLVTGGWEDVFILSVKMSRPKNFFNENYFKMRGYNCLRTQSLQGYAATLLSFWGKKNNK